MTAKRLSPTANLLRKSRLFSLPPPLPRPGHDLTSTSNFTSETATLPYPTHAAIESPQSSLSRGDWGLKRPLPLRATTETSTPTIRVGAVDTLEHITDFESASDHVLTLRKWQELNLSMSMPEAPKRRVQGHSAPKWQHKSVFERDTDNTAPENQNIHQEARRWKFSGPWLAGKSEGDFQEYLRKEIRRRKPEFRGYLRKIYLAARTAEQRRLTRDKGEDFEETSETSQLSDGEFRAYIKHLRHNPSTLSTIIHQFLDLPNPPAPVPEESYLFASPDKTSKAASKSLYSESGPPKTHPSAGLSYLRASSYLNNHPKLGPQLHKTPVQARVLRPMRSSTGRVNSPLLGVAGVAAEDTALRGGFNENRPGIEFFDGTVSGGTKTWCTPKRANIDAQGRIKLSVEEAQEDTVSIHEEKTAKKLVVDGVMEVTDRTWPKLAMSSGSTSDYGLESRTTKIAPRAEPIEVPEDHSTNRRDIVGILENGL